MNITIAEAIDRDRFYALVRSDDGYEIKFHVDSDEEEVTEFYIDDVDFKPSSELTPSMYIIIDGKPKSISSIISEINVAIPDLKEQIAAEEEADEDYEETKRFYYNNGRI